MTVTVEIPDNLQATLQEGWGDDLRRPLLEAFAVEAYRTGKMSTAQLRDLLGFGSRWETEDFLAAHHAWPGTTAEEVISDLDRIERARLRES